MAVHAGGTEENDMKWPFAMRSQYDADITLIGDRFKSIEKELRHIDSRLHDIERQFVTKYDDTGKIVETLADVPLDQRRDIKVLRRPKNPMQGMSWPQRKAFLEKTDGGRLINHE